MAEPLPTAAELDRLLSRFEEASVALHQGQTRSAQDRWEAAGDIIRDKFDQLRCEVEQWRAAFGENALPSARDTLAEVTRLREQRGDLLRLIRDLLDSDDCWFDHHGGCQAHGYLSLAPGEQCPHAEAKALLDAEGVAR